MKSTKMDFEMTQRGTTKTTGAIDDLTNELLKENIFIDAKMNYLKSKFISEELKRLQSVVDTDLYYACKSYVQRGEALAKAEYSVRYQEKRQKFSDALGSRLINTLTCIIVVISLTSVSLETMTNYNPKLNNDHTGIFYRIELSATLYFSVEVLVRLFNSPNKNAFFLELTNVVDIVSIMPFYLELLMKGTEAFKALRFLRLYRLFRYMVYFAAFHAFAKAAYESLRVLYGSFLMMILMMTFMSSFLYYSERGILNEKDGFFYIEDCNCLKGEIKYSVMREKGLNVTDMCKPVKAQFHSIPQTMWWAVLTFGTVGYGDLTPQCPMGKFFGGLSIILAAFFFSMPIAIFGAYFTNHATQTTIDLKEKKTAQVSGEAKELTYIKSPGEALVTHLASRLGSITLQLDNPEDKVLMLIDEYLKCACPNCCAQCHQQRSVSAPSYNFSLQLRECPRGATCPS